MWGGETLSITGFTARSSLSSGLPRISASHLLVSVGVSASTIALFASRHRGLDYDDPQSTVSVLVIPSGRATMQLQHP